MKKTVFSHILKDEILYTVQDNGKSLLNSEEKSISFVINENGECLLCELGNKRYNGNITEYDVIIKASGEVVSKVQEPNTIFEYYEQKVLPRKNLPFVIYSVDEGKEEYRIPNYMEEIFDLKQNNVMKNCYYILAERKFLPCKVDVQTSDTIKKMKISFEDVIIFEMEKIWHTNEELLNLDGKESKAEWQENIIEDNEENEQDEKIEIENIEVNDIAAYDVSSVEKIKDIMPNSSEPIGKDIKSGAEFKREEEHLDKIVKKLEEKIQNIQLKSTFTSKYATVRGGDDGTEFMQLKGDKEFSEEDRR